MYSVYSPRQELVRTTKKTLFGRCNTCVFWWEECSIGIAPCSLRTKGGLEAVIRSTKVLCRRGESARRNALSDTTKRQSQSEGEQPHSSVWIFLAGRFVLRSSLPRCLTAAGIGYPAGFFVIVGRSLKDPGRVPERRHKLDGQTKDGLWMFRVGGIARKKHPPSIYILHTPSPSFKCMMCCMACWHSPDWHAATSYTLNDETARAARRSSRGTRL